MTEQIKEATILGADLRALRVSRGVSQRQLASRIGARKNFINSMEKGREVPTVAMLDKIMEALREVDELAASPLASVNTDYIERETKSKESTYSR